MHSRTLIPLALVAACKLPPPPPPAAEFLVSAGDQTYWVRSDRKGVRVRGSPLILAHTGGRYYEVYVGEVDHSYPRALFAGERVFRRELATGDSAIIFDDTTVASMAAAYQRSHPRQRPLASDEDPDDDVDLAAVGETDILNVLGPYVALEHRLSVGSLDGHEREDTTRAVVDLRSGKRVPIDDVLRDSAVHEAAGVGGLLNRRWKHERYEVISRYDTTGRANALLLRDRRGREWKLGIIGSTFIQIFWLDKPRVDARTRRSLSEAFDDATAYGGSTKQVSRKRARPPSVRPRPGTTAAGPHRGRHT